jgi:hypothetical protein
MVIGVVDLSNTADTDTTRFHFCHLEKAKNNPNHSYYKKTIHHIRERASLQQA